MTTMTLDLFGALPEERPVRGTGRTATPARRERAGTLRREGRGRAVTRERGDHHSTVAPGSDGMRNAAPEAAGMTLDALVTGAWEALIDGTTTTCPVCSGKMVPRQTAGAGVVGGRCADCASTIA